MRDAPPAALVEALTGVALGPDELRAAVAGCGVAVDQISSGQSYPGDWVTVEGSQGRSWLRRVAGAWRLVANVRDALEIRYDEFASGHPSVVRFRTTPAQGAATDLTLRLSQVDINVPLGAEVFEVDVPDRCDAIDARGTATRRSARAEWRRSTIPHCFAIVGGIPVSAKKLRVVARAHAKVNLDLRVLGNRPDGYHELRTVFQTIELHDTLICVEPAGAVRDQVPYCRACRSTIRIWCGRLRRDSGLRSAARATPLDTAVTIEKVIPVQAGLGGGSADASAALSRSRPALGWRADQPVARGRGRSGSRRSVLPVWRHGAGARTWGRDLSARRSAARTRSSSSGRRSECRRRRHTPGTTRTGRRG